MIMYGNDVLRSLTLSIICMEYLIIFSVIETCILCVSLDAG